MTAPTVVTVELVPDDRRIGLLADRSWVVTQRFPDGRMAVHLPDDGQRAMHPTEFGRLVAHAEGAVFVAPPSWLWFARTDTSWTAWDHLRCAPHGQRNCPAVACRDDDSDVTTRPVPVLTFHRRTEVPV